MYKQLMVLVRAGVLGLAPAAFGGLVGWWTMDAHESASRRLIAHRACADRLGADAVGLCYPGVD